MPTSMECCNVHWQCRDVCWLACVLCSPDQASAKVVDKARHCVLETVHPSPLSAHRGFLGCKHFSKANAYLTSKGLAPIDWNLPAL